MGEAGGGGGGEGGTERRTLITLGHTPYSKSLERAWGRGIVDRAKEYSFVLSTMLRLHARSWLLELGVYIFNVSGCMYLIRLDRSVF